MVDALMTLFQRDKMRARRRRGANFASINLVADVQESAVKSMFLVHRIFQLRNLFFLLGVKMPTLDSARIDTTSSAASGAYTLH
jgi:hypothetical protein